MDELENYKNLYLRFYDRLITMATLINSGGIVSIATLYSGDTKKKYQQLSNIGCFSYYPLNLALYCFVFALLLGLVIVFIDFAFFAIEYRKLKNRRDGKNVPACTRTSLILSLQWSMGLIAILLTVIGVIIAVRSLSMIRTDA